MSPAAMLRLKIQELMNKPGGDFSSCATEGGPPGLLDSGPVSGYGVTFLRRKDGLVG